MNKSQNNSAQKKAYSAVIDAFDNSLRKSFDLLIRSQEPGEIIPVDCLCVLMDCERLIECLKSLKLAATHRQAKAAGEKTNEPK